MLISQGSILQALRIITGASESPWEDYDIKKLYNLNKKEKRQLKSNYASINCLYDKNNINLHKLKKEKVIPSAQLAGEKFQSMPRLVDTVFLNIKGKGKENLPKEI